MDNDFKPEVGHKFRFTAPDSRGWRGYVACEALEVDQPRKLSCTWVGDEKINQTLVIYTLEPVPEGTRFTLVHGTFEGLKGWLTSKLVFGPGWKKHMLRKRFPAVLVRLDAYVDGDAPEPGEAETT
jgi:uncharacterized protein YndB with AHSA1/START domain